MELFDKVKRQFARSVFVALAVLMVGCGRNTDDVMVNLKGAIIGLENGDTRDVENATNTAEKYIDEIIKKAEREGNTEERYKAEYMRLLNYSIENLSEAQKGLVGLQSALNTGVFSMIQDARSEDENSDSNNNIKKEKAYDFSKAVVKDFIIAVSNYNTAKELEETAKEGNTNDSSFTTAWYAVESALSTFSGQLFDDTNGYATRMKVLYHLSDDEINAISELHAEPGYNSDEFIKEVQELANAIVDRAFNPEKDNGESEKDKDTKSSNDSKVSEDSKGSDDSIIQRRLNDFTKKWEEAWKNFESKFKGRIAELGTQVEQTSQEATNLAWKIVEEYGDDEQKKEARQYREEQEGTEPGE